MHRADSRETDGLSPAGPTTQAILDVRPASFPAGHNAGSRSNDEGAYRTSETHNLPQRSKGTYFRTSEDFDWHSLHATLSSETPFDAAFDPIKDLWLTIPLTGALVGMRYAGRWQQKRTRPGMLSTVPGNMDVHVRVENANDVLNLHLRDSVLKAAAAELVPGDPKLVEIAPVFGVEDATAVRMCLIFQQALEQPDSPSPLLVDQWAAVLANYMVRTYATKAPAKVGLLAFKMPTNSMKKVQDYIEAYMHGPILLSELAGIASISTSQFIRQFKASTGITPHQYVMRVRIERARHLLQSSNISILSIAFDCGFSSQEHLTRLFARSVGITPAVYRREARG